MAWIAELQPSGIFRISNEVSHPLLDGAFRGNIPESSRIDILNLISEAPAMLLLLEGVLTEVDNLISIFVEESGGGEAGRKAAQAAAPNLFLTRDVVADQIKRSRGG